jgi:AsmA protein
VACLLFAVVAPLYFADRRSDEPFAISSVIASPQDLHVVTAPTRLSDAPDLTLDRGIVYAYGKGAPGAPGAPITNILLDDPVFTLNVSGLRPSSAAGSGKTGVVGPGDVIAPLIEQIIGLGFDRVTIRRGTLHLTAADGRTETLSDIQAEITGRRKGQIASRGTFTIRGQRLAFDATIGQPADKRLPQRWPMKASLKGNLLEATFDGHVDVDGDLQLSGLAEASTPSLRRIGRWFGLPLHMTEGFNATSIKGRLNWARRSLAFEKATVVVDGNEANGRIAFNLGGERPQIDATLDFTALSLIPYLDSMRTQFFGFELPSTYWALFDLSLPMIRSVDADLRISARKVTYKNYAFGRGGATITAQAGKLQADITELELNAGTATAQVTAIMSETVPRYALRAKLDNFDAGPASTVLFGAAALAGRATVTLDLTSTGYSPSDIIGRLSGKTTLTMPEGGRVALDLKALRQVAASGVTRGWGLAGKASTAVEQLEARALVIDGIAFGEATHVGSGGAAMTAAGRFGLDDGNMEVRLTMKDPPAPEPGKAAGGKQVISLRGPWYEPVIRGEGRDADMSPR